MINIVGGAGFIGTRLSALLLRDNLSFKIFDKIESVSYPSKSVFSDVTSVESLMSSLTTDGILINLAAEHRDDVKPLSLYDDVNVKGAKNLCMVAREKHIKKIIFTSSVAVYGFAPLGTDESGHIKPFNEYGRTKYEAELVFREWQQEDPLNRVLVIVRPTVIFGEQNRGNVYNLLRQIASGRFVRIGRGENCKSMAYVENIAGFLKFAINFEPGVHLYNYVDKPDFTMNELVCAVHRILKKSEFFNFSIPYAVGLLVGYVFDIVAAVTGKRLAISSIRIRKFCSDSMFDTKVKDTGYIAPVSFLEALERTVRHEFCEPHEDTEIFYTE